jgi:hypothetical protein
MQLARSLLNDTDVPSISNITASGASRSGNVVTITTSAAHGLQIGNIVQVASVTDTTFNGTQTVTAVPSSTTFQYNQSAANASSGNGTVSLLIQGDVFTDSVLLPFVAKAYRKVQLKLMGTTSPTETAETIITLPAGATVLSDSTTPQLPVDFLAPEILRERITGNLYFGPPMSRVNVLPSEAQSALNGCFAWYDEQLNFLGALNSTDISLRYYKGQSAISDASSVLTIRGCLDVVADWAAFLAAESRSAGAGAMFASLYKDDLQEFLSMQAQSRQYSPARRRPNNAVRRGAYGWGYGNFWR